MRMNKTKEKWMTEIFHSMEGSQRVSPKPELFVRIQDHLMHLKNERVTLDQWKYIAIAAIFILTLNSAALIFHKEHQKVAKAPEVVLETYDKVLITSYKIY